MPVAQKAASGSYMSPAQTSLFARFSQNPMVREVELMFPTSKGTVKVKAIGSRLLDDQILC